MQVQELKTIINESKRIVFFGGAGVSTASGIPDFRSANGLYHEKYHRTFSPEEMVSHMFFTDYTEDFFKFYKQKLVYPEAKPNACHIALAKLEKEGKLKAVVTQNIDGLHQEAGSKKVFELHGSVKRNYCTQCHTFYDADYVMQAKGIPYCEKCGGIIKPDVVLYGEGLDNRVVSQAIEAIENADTLIIGGTSLIVYPAAGLIDYFRGNKLVLINKSQTATEGHADLVIHEDIAKVMQAAVLDA